MLKVLLSCTSAGTILSCCWKKSEKAVFPNTDDFPRTILTRRNVGTVQSCDHRKRDSSNFNRFRFARDGHRLASAILRNRRIEVCVWSRQIVTLPWESPVSIISHLDVSSDIPQGNPSRKPKAETRQGVIRAAINSGSEVGRPLFRSREGS